MRYRGSFEEIELPATDDPIHLRRLLPGTVIDRTRADEVVGPDLVAPALVCHLIRTKLSVCCVLLRAMMIDDLGSQDPERFTFVRMLIPPVDEDLETGRFVCHANCGVRLVLMLSTLPVATLRFYEDLCRRNLDRATLNDRKNPYGEIRRLPSPVLFRRRDALDAVLATLTAEDAPRIRAGDLGCEVAGGRVEKLRLESVRLCVLQIRREEILSEQLGVVAALSSFDFEDDFVGTKDAPTVESTTTDSVHG